MLPIAAMAIAVRRRLFESRLSTYSFMALSPLSRKCPAGGKVALADIDHKYIVSISALSF
jgi:hypothetical protein